MNTWPADIPFQYSAYSYESAPDVSRSASVSGHVRQRRGMIDRDDRLPLSVIVTDSQRDTLETFFLENPDTFLASYFDCDIAQTGTFRMLPGTTTTPLPPNHWRISFVVHILDRQHDIGRRLFELSKLIPGQFGQYKTATAALARADLEGIV